LEVWEKALAEKTLQEVIALSSASNSAFHFPDSTWVRVVYDFSRAYEKKVLPGEHLLSSLVPLYLGRTGSFVLQTQGSDEAEVESAIRALAQEFVEKKSYLLQLWSKSSEAPS
jgi:hypothetical protein